MTISKDKMETFAWKLCGSLEAIGIEVHHIYVTITANMGKIEEMLKLIELFPNIRYFLLIGNDNSCHSISKELKQKLDMRGNYKDYRKMLLLCDWLPICLEINKQCRGLNYSCPLKFPVDTVFIHFKICKWQISCGTNATKFVSPDVMIACCNSRENDYVEKLEHLCTKLTGKIERKQFQNTIITFENCLEFTSSFKIASKFYETAATFLTWTKIGIAEISFNSSGIKSCIAMLYDDNMGSGEIMKKLNLCRNCNELRLSENEVTPLPEQINRCNTQFSNINTNFKAFEFPLKYQPSEEECLEDETFKVEFPKIIQRNHVLRNIDDFSLLENDKWIHHKQRLKE